jgi:hypothetical protein
VRVEKLINPWVTAIRANATLSEVVAGDRYGQKTLKRDNRLSSGLLLILTKQVETQPGTWLSAPAPNRFRFRYLVVWVRHRPSLEMAECQKQ